MDVISPTRTSNKNGDSDGPKWQRSHYKKLLVASSSLLGELVLVEAAAGQQQQLPKKQSLISLQNSKFYLPPGGDNPPRLQNLHSWSRRRRGSGGRACWCARRSQRYFIHFCMEILLFFLIVFSTTIQESVGFLFWYSLVSSFS